MQIRREKTIWIAVGFVALSVALGVLFLFDPARNGFYPQCWFHELTGLYCPGCGSLRAMHHLLHGEMTAAARSNPLLVVSIPLVAWFLLKRVIKSLSGQKEASVGKNEYRLYWLILLVLVVFGIARNLPYEAFAWMSP